MGISEKGLKSFHIRKHEKAKNEVEPSLADRELLVNVLTSGSRNPAPMTGDYRMFDTYITYLCNSLLSGRQDSSVSLHGLIGLFTIVVEYFTATTRVKNTVEQFLHDRCAEIVEVFPKAETDHEVWRRSRLTDTVNCIALWLMIEDFGDLFYNETVRKDFYEHNEKMANNLARNKQELEYDGKFTIPAFAERAGLVPRIASWVNAPQANPFEEIPKSSLNARLILRIGRIKITWTFDISKHLKFENSTLSLFCMPSRLMFESGMQETDNPEKALTQMGFSRSYVYEVKRSYLLLFGPQFKPIFEDEFASDDFPVPKDPYLRTICLRSPDHANLDKLESWLKSEFPYLWPRIKELEQHVRNIQPDSLWKLLYRDRRDSLAWYTFMFAVIVLILTFLSTAFTGIQTVKAFLPSSPPASTDQTSTSTHQASSTTKFTSLVPTATVLTKSSAAVQTLLTSTYSSATATATPPPTARSSGLSAGRITGIVVGTFFLFLALIWIIFTFLRKRVRKAEISRPAFDTENIAKPSYAFSPSSDRFGPPHRQITEFSGSTDTSAPEEIRAHYIRSPIVSESTGQLPRALTVTFD